MRKKIYVGIDLGTTYSAVAHFNKNTGSVEILKNGYDKDITPSVIMIENGRVTIGEDAKQAQKEGNPNTAGFYKSMMGEENYTVYIDGEDYTAEQLSGLFLKELKRDIEEANDVEIAGAVITCPAYFEEKQIVATRKAGEAAGFKVLKIINEPTSAIISYGLTGSGSKHVMVYDLGGGTFDVTVAKIVGTNVEVIATNGNHQLGGKDWDSVLQTEVMERFYNEFEVDIQQYPDAYKELQVKCEDLKKKLSNMAQATITISCEGYTGRYEITREFFESNTANFLDETLLLINKCFDEIGNGFGWHSLDEVVLVGGSTRMPQVKDMIVREYGKQPVTRNINVDTIVASGASMQAELCVSNTFTMTKVEQKPGGGMQKITLTVKADDISDITSHSLGILVYDSDEDEIVNKIVIPKNSKYGVFFDEEYFSRNDKIKIYVLQGESTNPFDSTLLYLYEIQGLTKGKDEAVIVGLRYNTDGLVDVQAKLDNITPLKINKINATEDISLVVTRMKEEASQAQLPYSKFAGISDIPKTKRDRFGNPEGSDYDLIPDGSMAGYKILFANLYYDNPNEMLDKNTFINPIRALEKKGFTVDYSKGLPSNLASVINDYCQVWIISNLKPIMTEREIQILANYYNEGHGLYIWGDNDPFYVDANVMIRKLFNTTMEGNYEGDNVIGIQKNGRGVGIIENHLITTGIVNIYEGITIAHINIRGDLKPLTYSSDGNVVTAYCESQERRILVDGGFTRLWCAWDAAGTSRYIVNAAAWLANLERFGYANPNRKKHSLKK